MQRRMAGVLASPRPGLAARGARRRRYGDHGAHAPFRSGAHQRDRASGGGRGATPRDIVVQFLLESTDSRSVGWTAGLALGGAGRPRRSNSVPVGRSPSGLRASSRPSGCSVAHRPRLWRRRRCVARLLVQPARASGGAVTVTARASCMIDDDERLNALLTEYLGKFGYSVRAATRPSAGLRSLESDPPDLVILDVMLSRDGRPRACAGDPRIEPRARLMLTARGDVMRPHRRARARRRRLSAQALRAARAGGANASRASPTRRRPPTRSRSVPAASK